MLLYTKLRTYSLIVILTLLIFPSNLLSKDVEFRLRVHQLPADYTESDIQAEIQFGRNLASKILAKYKLHPDKKLQEFINLLGNGIASSVGRAELKYYFAVLDTDDLNAYACPGGYVFITTGAIKAMDNEAQLAGVLAHEIGHIDKRHEVIKLKIRGKEDSISSGVAAAFGGSSAAARIIFNQLTDKAVQILFEEGRSKADELEADSVGLDSLVALNYDWQSYRNYLQKIDKLLNTENGRVLSRTHPTINDRVNNLDSRAVQNNYKDNNGRKNEKRFKDTIKL